MQDQRIVDNESELDERVHEEAQRRRLNRLNGADDEGDLEAIITEGEAEAADVNNQGRECQIAYLDGSA